MKQVEEAQSSIRHAAKHVQRVALPDADVREMLVADMAQRGRDTIDEGLTADECVVGQHVRAVGEMLAGAETDLDVQRTILAEQPRGGDLALFGHRDLRKKPVDQLLLALAQFIPARPAVKAVEGRRIAGLVRSHGERLGAQSSVQQGRRKRVP